MKNTKQRIQHYKAKTHFDTVTLMYESTFDLTYEQIARYQPKHVWLIEMCKKILGKEGVVSILYNHYISYAEEILRIFEKFKGETMKTEIRIIFEKWTKRGLDQDILNKIGFTIWGKLSKAERFPCVFPIYLG